MKLPENMYDIDPAQEPEQTGSDTPRTMAFIESMCPFVECEWTMGAEKLMCEMETDLTAAHEAERIANDNARRYRDELAAAHKRVQRLRDAIIQYRDAKGRHNTQIACDGLLQALAETENEGEQP